MLVLDSDYNILYYTILYYLAVAHSLSYSSPRFTHLPVLQRVQPGIPGRADDLVVAQAGRHSDRGPDAVDLPAVLVRHGEVLPWLERLTVNRAFEDPVARPRRVSGLDNHVGHLVDLQQKQRSK